MRPDRAQGQARRRPLAVVFGDRGGRGVADIIVKSLEAEGFEARVLGGSDLRLPVPGRPSSLDELKALLRSLPKGAFVHPGTSVWAERPELVSVGQELGLNVVAPPPRATTLLRNRLAFLSQAERLGIPNLILYPDPLHSVREVNSLIPAGDRRFPFVLKCVQGGGGLGHLVAYQPDDLERRLPLWLEQLQRNLGEAIVFAERYLEGARHIIIPFARFSDGYCETFSSIDASLQCHCRKIIEFCPAAALDSQVEQVIRNWTRQLAEHCDYVGVGGFEYLVDGSRAFLIEGTARLGGNFQVWEKAEGTSAVAWQLAAMAQGVAVLPDRKPTREWKSVIGLRIYAEDPILQLPQPGIVQAVSATRSWQLPGAAAALNLPLHAGMDVSPTDDAFLGLLVAGGADFQTAQTLVRGVLGELWVAGSLQTNERFLSELLLHPWVREGMFHAGFVDEEFVPEIRPPVGLIPLFASVCASLPNPSLTTSPVRWAAGDQWIKGELPAIPWKGQAHLWDHDGLSGISGVLQLPEGREVRVCAFPVFEDRWQVRMGEWVLSVRRVPLRMDLKTLSRPLLSLIRGKVDSIRYREGAVVPAHEPLVIIESLRMLVPHALPVAVRLKKWNVSAEELVEAGQELSIFEVVKTTKN